MNSIREARSPCGRALVTEPRSAAHPVLTIDIASQGHPGWHAAVTAHTPEEITLPLVDALARGLRENPEQVLGPTDPAAGYRRREPADGWSIAFDRPDAQLHSAPDRLACFAARTAQPTDTADPRTDPPGYWFIAGPGLSPDRWSVTLSAGAPPHLVDLLHDELSRPSPARRSVRTVPVHHLPYVTVRSIDEFQPARAAAVLRSIGLRTAETSTSIGSPAAPPSAPATGTTAAPAPRR
ncbi:MULTISPECIES: hypothetical protein [unclassified Kitasatospora]|uniref:hypothetical protein n=1 Tax=unclassified Kitasatospora TaxID=2633591 RepID=UPI000709D823|nr:MULTISPECIES: hypothetical protein [unclassified Kitasatospora]KQV20911.1 hypothetical protein ASC99_20625 [Kitasatospora sp. Root107]KRB60436.1 hypothetical protein ASE03_12560 [Kitasatospora sp. Root187]